MVGWLIVAIILGFFAAGMAVARYHYTVLYPLKINSVMIADDALTYAAHLPLTVIQGRCAAGCDHHVFHLHK
jgi:hypothetical protein